MMHTSQALYEELHKAYLEVNKQIDQIKHDAATPDEWPFQGVVQDPYRMMTRDGKPILTDLLVARAQLLSGMAALKASVATSRDPGKGKW